MNDTFFSPRIRKYTPWALKNLVDAYKLTERKSQSFFRSTECNPRIPKVAPLKKKERPSTVPVIAGEITMVAVSNLMYAVSVYF
jgi:hypothetical protein